MRIIIILCLFVCVLALSNATTDFYEILGVGRTATAKEIRIAFKKLVVRKHPDKNKEDPQAHEKFIKITRAYEVLKDEELRRKYDVHGEEGLKNEDAGGGRYESWQFYREEFGIYDEDQEIITLTPSDFETSVRSSDDVWFINFYSPYCSHCHNLAPTWREVSRELEGVIRVGAVNCHDERNLCGTEGIRGYPTLALYSEGNRQSTYHGEHMKDRLVDFVLENIPINEIYLNDQTMNRYMQKSSNPWIVSICGESKDCLLPQSTKKLAIMLAGLVKVGTLDCHWQASLCSKLAAVKDGGIIFLSNDLKQLESDINVYRIDSLYIQEIGRLVLERLPSMKELTPDDLKNMQEQLKFQRGGPFLIHFYADVSSADIELRKLPVILSQSDIMTGQIDCNKYRDACHQFYLLNFPKFAIFKRGGYEFHYGRTSSHDLTNFARGSVENAVLSLDPTQFQKQVLEERTMWLIDFFAPWCPPCMRILPQFKAVAKQNMDKRIHFGTVDCTVHRQLCQQNHIRSYPSLHFFTNSTSHEYPGPTSLSHIKDFIDDVLNPKVVVLDPTSFSSSINDGKWWLVDFFAPWCAPCQTLSGEWRRLAKMFTPKEEVIKVGSIDCAAHEQFCRQHHVRGYPTIRLYRGAQSNWEYSSFHRDADYIYRWAFDFLPSKVRLVRRRFFHSNVINSAEPWLLDFFAPWCGPCRAFAPKFAALETLLPEIRLGKVNCDESGDLCREARIDGYPTVMLYPGHHGKAVGLEVHSFDTQQIVREVRKLLKPKHTEL